MNPPRELVLVQRHLLDDDAEGDGDHGQVDAARPERRERQHRPPPAPVTTMAAPADSQNETSRRVPSSALV